MKALLQTIPRTELAAVIQEFYKRASPETRATVEEVFGVEPVQTATQAPVLT